MAGHRFAVQREVLRSPVPTGEDDGGSEDLSFYRCRPSQVDEFSFDATTILRRFAPVASDVDAWEK